jgi:hypothetical protein
MVILLSTLWLLVVVEVDQLDHISQTMVEVAEVLVVIGQQHQKDLVVEEQQKVFFRYQFNLMK